MARLPPMGYGPGPGVPWTIPLSASEYLRSSGKGASAISSAADHTMYVKYRWMRPRNNEVVKMTVSVKLHTKTLPIFCTSSTTNVVQMVPVAKRYTGIDTPRKKLTKRYQKKTRNVNSMRYTLPTPAHTTTGMPTKAQAPARTWTRGLMMTPKTSMSTWEEQTAIKDTCTTRAQKQMITTPRDIGKHPQQECEERTLMTTIFVKNYKR
mmetsp:Transcript_38850/g.103150  ORF Transcript_38850/g.103150 Transcript_38850/m.103150 type:complete len:208 (+) Transcript_38850:478-1101(+)